VRNLKNPNKGADGTNAPIDPEMHANPTDSCGVKRGSMLYRCFGHLGPLFASNWRFLTTFCRKTLRCFFDNFFAEKFRL
jgi:hypothetical protein